MRIESFDSPVAVAARAADLVMASPGPIVLPAGETPRPLYAELRRRGARIRAWQLDEILGTTRFADFLRAELPDAELHLLDGDARYATDLGTPDLVVLGIGVNGHVGFNEPGSTRLDGARVVTLAPESAKRLGATHGVTLGMREILSARRIVLLATGDAKRAVVRSLIGGRASSRLPASLLCGHGDVTLLADRDAMGEAA